MPDSVMECVPNFSEGASADVVRQIVQSMRIEGVRLLEKRGGKSGDWRAADSAS